MTNYLQRPDEQAAQVEIERAESRNRNLSRGIKTAASLGSAAVGLGIASKVAPFLSKYIPVDLALKGISKVSPQLGNFLKKGQSLGLDIKKGLDFINEKMPKEEEKKESPKEDRNVIQKYSPELYQFIREHVKKGKSPLEAGSLAQSDKKFASVIKKLTEDYRVPFSNLLELVFGDEMSRQKALGNFNKKKRGLVDEEMERFEQGYGQQQPQNQPQQQQQQDPLKQALLSGDAVTVAKLAKVSVPQAENLIMKFIQNQPPQNIPQQAPQAAQQQGGQGQAALMQILQKIQQMRGGQQ